MTASLAPAVAALRDAVMALPRAERQALMSVLWGDIATLNDERYRAALLADRQQQARDRRLHPDRPPHVTVPRVRPARARQMVLEMAS